MQADKFDGLGQYIYPDGSIYTGSWEAGLKHGHGVYWDTVKVRGDGTEDEVREAAQWRGRQGREKEKRRVSFQTV